MGRKPKRRPVRRQGARRAPEDTTQRDRMVESAARALLASRPREQLRDELAHREFLVAEADRIAQLDPNPANLIQYRASVVHLDAVRHAIVLAGEVAVREEA